MAGPDTSAYTNRFDQGFDIDTDGFTTEANGWSGIATILPSGTDTIVSADGVSHARFEQSDATGGLTGPFTSFDGYRTDFTDGFEAEVKIYLDPNAWTDGEGFDYSVAVNNQSGTHLRDFIFHVTQDTSSQSLLIGASNNSNDDPREDLDTLQNHYEVTTAGWYTFKHNFYDNGSGVLAVDMTVEDSSGSTLFTETRSDPGDLISTVVGGNRYGWFTNIDVADGILVDSVVLDTSSTGLWKVVNTSGLILGEFDDQATAASNAGPGNAVINPAGEFVVSAGLSIQDAVDAASAGDVINVLAGTYAEDVVIDKSITLLAVDGPQNTIIDGQNGELGAILIDSGVDDVVIGGESDGDLYGFTVLGNNGNGAIENGAIYLRGNHDNITILGNIVEARGDAGLMNEYGGILTNSTIEYNEFTGQTFEGANPEGFGFSTQFNVGNNVPRQLVVLGNGGGDAASANVTNLVFSNNVLSGTAGGLNVSAQEQGNTLATIDAANSVIDNNEFTGITARYAAGLRVRRPDTDITNNSFDNSDGGDTRGVFVQNQSGTEDMSGNTFTGGTDDDLFAGTPGNDAFTLGGGNDTAQGGAGNDTIDGGADVDTAVFSGSSADHSYNVNTDASGRVTGFTSVIDNNAGDGDEGTDLLTDVEVISFLGDGVTLDTTQPVQLFNAVGTLVGTFDTIQEAVDAAGNGFTVNVGAGTFEEQVVVDGLNDLTIVGQGDSTIIRMPDAIVFTIDTTDGSSRDRAAVVTVTDATGVVLQDVLVDGAGKANLMPSGTSADFEGILYWDAGGTIDDVTVLAARDPLQGDGTVSGNQRGNGILIFNDDGTARTLLIEDSTVADFQKNGITVHGAGLDATINNNTVTGGGFLPAANAQAQNGIQVSGDALATITGNTIEEIGYQRGDYVTTGILAYDPADGLIVTGNTFTGATDGSTTQPTTHIPVYVLGYPYVGDGEANNATITGNTFDGTVFGVIVEGEVDGFTIDSNTYLNSIASVTNVTNGGTWTGTGVEVYGENLDAGFTFTASPLPDLIVGSDFADVINGADGNDEFEGGGGNDTIDGGADTDTAYYDGPAADYTVAVSVDTAGRAISFDTVTDINAGNGDEGADTLLSVELLGFSDATFDLSQAVHLFDAGGNLTGTFDTIQAAVDAASAGSTINVAAGTYREQVTVDGIDDLTIIGAGDSTIIEMIDTPAVNTDNGGEAVVAVLNGTGVTLQDLQVDGRGLGSSNQFYGVYYGNAGGTVDDLTVTAIRAPLQGDGTPAGTQLGRAIFANNQDAQARTLNVTDNTVTDFQKNGIDLRGDGLTVNVTGNNVVGSGFLPAANAIAQNGIVLVFGPTGVISGNTISEIGYQRGDYSTSGILGFDAGDGVEVTNNVITAPLDGGVPIPSNLNGIIFVAGESDDLVITGNTIDGALNGVVLDDNVDNPTVSGNTFQNMTPSVDTNTGEGTITGNFVSYDGSANDAAVDIAGSEGSDALTGSDFDDRLEGGLGDDSFDGGAGTDTAVIADGGGLAVDLADYDLSGLSAIGGTVSGTLVGPDGTETLSGIEIIEVANTGSSTFIVIDGMSIQSAIDAASDGDTILVQAGTFTENLVIDKAITLLGAQAGVDGNDGGRGTGESIINGNATFGIIVESDDVVIDGFEITGFARDGINIRTLEDAKPGDASIGAFRSNVDIQNNWIHESGATGQRNGVLMGEFMGGPTISSENAELNDIVISGNRIEFVSSSSRAIALTNQFAFVELTDSQISGNDLDAAWSFFGSAGPDTFRVDNASIVNNTFEGTANSYNLFNSLVDGNTFNYVALFGVDNSTVSNNVFNVSEYYGLGLWGDEYGSNVSQNSTVSGNTFNYNTVVTLEASVSGMKIRDGADASSIDFDGNTFNDGGVNDPSVVAKDVLWDGGADPDALDAADLQDSSDTQIDVSLELVGKADDDTLTGGDQSDVLNGGEGNDVLKGGLGDDSYIGGEGIDRAVIAEAGGGSPFTAADFDFSGLSFAGGEASGTLVGPQGTETLSGIEIVEIANDGSSIFVVGEGMDLQAAIDAAGAGDTIYLLEGVHAGSFTIGAGKDGLQILGVNEGVAGSDGARDLTTGVGESTLEGRLVIHSDGVEVDGVRFAEGAGGGAFELSAIHIQADNATIQNSVFFRSGAVDGDTSRAIINSVGSGDGTTVANNAMTGWHTGTYVNGASNVSVTGNEFIGNLVGMSADFYTGATALSIDGNTFDNTLEDLGLGAANAPGWGGEIAATNNSFTLGIFDYDGSANSNLNGAGNTFVPGSVTVSSHESVFTSIQQAVDFGSTSDGDTITVSAGTFNESVDVTKAVNFVGAGAGNTIVTAASGAGFDLQGDLGTSASITIDGFDFTGSATVGVDFDDNAILGTLTILNSNFEANGYNGVRIGGNGSLVDLDNVVVTNSTFTGNGEPQTSSGDGDLLFFQYAGNVTLTDLVIVGQDRGNGPGENAIQFRGDAVPMGTVVLTNVDISGEYEKVGLAIYNYSSIAGLSATNVAINATTGWSLPVNIDGVGGTIDFSILDIDVAGSNGAVGLQGDAGVNTIISGDEDAFINGKGGDDILTGGAGDDTIRGGDRGTTRIVLNDDGTFDNDDGTGDVDADISGVESVLFADASTFTLPTPAGAATDATEDVFYALDLATLLGVNAADYDFAILSGPAWLGALDTATGVASGTPLNGDVGDIAVTYTATETATGLVIEDTVSLSVINVNDAPTSSVIAAANVDEDSALNLDISGSFADIDVGDTLTFSATLQGGGALPAWLSFDTNTGIFTGTPTNDDVGAISVTVGAVDGGGLSAPSRTFTLTVDNVNDDPTVVGTGVADQTFDEDTPISFSVASAFDDVDASDTLTFSATGLPAGLSISSTGVISGTPTTQIGGVFPVTVTANDGNGGTVDDTFDLTITGVNDAPVASDDVAVATFDADQSFSGTVGSTIAIASLATDVDNPLDPASFSFTNATYTTTTGSSGGTANLAELGFSYTPGTGDIALDPANANTFFADLFESLDEGDSATIEVFFTASDGDLSDGGSIIFTVDGVAEAPELAAPISDVATAEDAAFVLDVSSNFSDADSDLTYSATLQGGGALPAWLSFNTTTGVFSGTPLNANVGTINVTVTATEQGGTDNVSDTFALEVTNVNDAPITVGAAPSISGDANSAITPIDLDNFFTDPDVGDTLTYSVTSGTLPAGLSLDTNTGVISGTPTVGFNGIVQVTANDGNGGTRARNLSIDIASSNTAPTVDAPFPAKTVNVKLNTPFSDTSLNVFDVFSDAEDADSALTYSITDFDGFDADDISIDGSTGVITLTPDIIFNFTTFLFDDNDTGTFSIDIEAMDTGGLTTTATLDLSVGFDVTSVDPDGIGYNAGGTVYFDVDFPVGNPNREFDSGTEFSTVLDGDGDFSFSSVPGFQAFYPLLFTSPTALQTAAFGIVDGTGTNLATGATQVGQLFAPLFVDGVQSTQISPLTTLLVHGPTQAILKANFAQLAGLSGSSPNLATLDYTTAIANAALETTTSDDAIIAAAASTIVRNAAQILGAGFHLMDIEANGTASFTLGEYVDFAYEALASEIAAGALDLATPPNVDGVIVEMETLSGLSINPAAQINLLSIVVNVVDTIETAVATVLGSPPATPYATTPTSGDIRTDFLTFLAASQIAVDGQTPFLDADTDFAVRAPIFAQFPLLTEAEVGNVLNIFGTKATEGPDVLVGLDLAGNEAELINGLGGDDTITGGEGNDTLDGGADNDTVDYSIETGGAGVTVNLSSIEQDRHAPGTATDTHRNTDTLSNFENVIGTTSGDAIYGNASDNVFTLPGLTGDDVDGRGGTDTVVFDFSRSDVSAVFQTDNFVFNTRNGTSSTDLVNIERIQFSDDLLIAPTNVEFGGSTTVAENTIELGSVTVTDPDQVSGHLMSVTDTHSVANFAVVDGILQLQTGWLDFDGGQTSFDVTVRAIDEDGLWFRETFTFNLTDVDEAPVGTIGNQAATEDTAFQLDLSTLLSDPEGNTLTFTKMSGPAWLNFSDSSNLANLVGTPANGDVTTGDAVVIKVSDGNTDNDREIEFDISVANTNDAPTSTAISAQTVDQDGLFSLELSSFFSDVDVGDALTYSATLAGGGALPSWLSVHPTLGRLRGFPEDADVGTISVTVNATDGSGAPATPRTFSITINNVNDAPTVSVIPDQAATEEQAFTFNVSSFFDDVDFDSGDSLTYSFSGLPNGLTGDSLTGAIAGIPDDVLTAGDNLVTVTATDGGGLTVQQTFNIDVTTVDDAPVALDPTGTTFDVDAGTLTAFIGSFVPLSNFATDVDSTLTTESLNFTTATIDGVVQASLAAAGVSYNSATGTFQISPAGLAVYEQLADGVVANLVVNFDVTDGTSKDSGTYTFGIRGINDAPVVDSEIADQAFGIGQAVNLVTGANFSDIDIGDTLTFSVNTLPGGLSFDSVTGAITGNPTTAGTTTVTVTASDGSLSVTDTFDIVVSSTLIGTENADTLTANTADDFTIRGLGGDDLLQGNDGNDEIFGGNGDDSLEGSGGDDTLRGEDGDDFLDGGDGNNTFLGGDGDDTASFRGATAGVIKTLTDPEFVDIENLEGSNFADILTGDNNSNFMYASGGNDLVDGAGGIDIYSGAAGSAGIFADLQSGFVFGGAQFGFDTIVNIEGLEGTSTIDILNGDAGENIFILTDGADQIDGRGGYDAISGQNLSTAITVDLGAGTVSFNPTQTVTNIEIVVGTDFNDDITGDSLDNILAGVDGNDTLNGAAGDDTLIGGDGDDNLDGGADEDTVLLGADSLADVTFDFLAGTLTSAADGTDTFNNVERFQLGDGTIVRLVGATGSAYSTIQAAIDDADEGDVILVGAGTYAENLIVDKGVTIAEVNGDVILDASGGLNGIVVNGGGSGQAVVLNDIEITGAQDIGVRVDPTADYDAISLADVTITDAGRRGFSLESGPPALQGAPDVDALNFTNVTVDGFGTVPTGSGVGLNINGYNGVVSLVGVDILNPGSDAHYGINLSGGSAGTTGGITLNDVDIGATGDVFQQGGLSIQDFTGLGAGNLSLTAVDIVGAIGDLTKDFALLYVDIASGIIDASPVSITNEGTSPASQFNIEDTSGTETSDVTGTDVGDSFLVVGDDVTISGGQGSDSLTTGPTGDTTVFDGGDGHDTVTLVNPLPASASFDIGAEAGGITTVDMGAGGQVDISNTEALNLILGDNGDVVTGSPDAFSLVFVTGGASGDNIDLAGASSATYITGGEGNDTIGLGGGSNTVDGGIGDDRIVSGSGTSDHITGGGGIDTVVVGGNFDPANFSGNVLTQSGTKTLFGVETVEFDDATVHLVGRGGFATIQAAIDNASAGDIVFVEAGTYAESLSITAGITLLGEDGTVIDATGNLNGVVVSGGSGAESVRIDNIDIANASDIGVRVDPTAAFDSLTLQNVEIVDSGRRGFSMEDGSGGTGSDIGSVSFANVLVDGFGTVPTGSGVGINVNDFANDASFTNVSIVNAGGDADYGINVTGGADGANGTISFSEVLIGSGSPLSLQKAGLALQDMADASTVDFAGPVSIDAIVNGTVEDFRPLLIDDVDGGLDLTNVSFVSTTGDATTLNVGFDQENRPQSNNLVSGTSNADVFTALGGDDTLQGLGGDDTFRIGNTGFAPSIDGGDDTDTLEVFNIDPSTSARFDFVNSGPGFDVTIVGGLGGSANVLNVESVVVALGDAGDVVYARDLLTGFADLTVIGGDGADLVDLGGSAPLLAFTGGSGMDVAIAGTGNGTFDGGDDVDAIHAFSNGLTTSEDVFNATADLGAGSFSYNGGGGILTATNVEHVLLESRTLIAAVETKAASTDADATTTGDLIGANDFDFNGDALSVTEIDGNGFTDGVAVVLASGATVTVTGDSFEYDANAAFDDLNVGEVTQDTFTYTIADGSGFTQTETVTIDVTGVNDPVVFDQPQFDDGVTEDAANPTLTTGGDLTFVDLDESGAYAPSFTPQGGSYIGTFALGAVNVAVGGAGTLAYTFEVDNTLQAVQELGEGETLVQLYDVELDDGDGSTGTTTVEITITGTNDVPVIEGTSVTTGQTDEDTKALLNGQIDATDADQNDTPAFSNDNANTVVTWNSVNGPTTTLPSGLNRAAIVAAFAINPTTGAWTYDPAALSLDALAEGESLTIEYKPTVTSGTDTLEGAVTITLDGVNDAPTPDTIATVTVTDLDNPGTIAGLFVDPDANDTIVFTNQGVDLPDILAINPDGTLSRALSTTIDAGTFNVTGVTATDNNGLAATGTGSFDVTISLAAALSVASEGDTIRIDGALAPGGSNPINVNDLTLELEDGTAGRTFTFSLGSGVTDITLVGGSGTDSENFVVTGNGENNVFDVGLSAGDDTLSGGGGIDFLDYLGSTEGVSILTPISQAFGDSIGTDIITGFEIVRGSAFDDTIVLGAGNDTILGTGGTDTILAGAGIDTLDYSSFTASMFVDLSTAIASGVPGTHLITAVENVIGTQASDNITGDSLDNDLSGGNGWDTLTGGEGDDTISGDGGNDAIEGGLGADVLDGGGGNNDAVDYRNSSAAVSVNLATGATSGGDAEGDTIISFERVFGSMFGDDLVGTAAVDRLFGNNGSDSIDGADGDDVLTGGGGADTLEGGLGADSLDGGLGNRDIVDYRDSSAGVTLNLATGAASGGEAEGDTISNFEGAFGSMFDDNIIGTTGADRLIGYNGADVLTGDDGNDHLDGRSGQDELIGGLGRDTLKGGGSNDVLNGGAGADELMGGNGADTFEFSATDSTLAALDVVTDFSGSLGDGDTLDFSTFASIFEAGGSFTGIAGEIISNQGGGVTTVEVDTDGNQTADFVLTLTGEIVLTQDDFLLI